jgi:transposase
MILSGRSPGDVAVALDDLGAVLDSRSFAADSSGYVQLIDWSLTLGGRLTFGIEGTGSYGAGLTSADGVVEMIRTIKVAKDVAVKARTSAMITLKQVLVNAPPELREELQPLTRALGQ